MEDMTGNEQPRSRSSSSRLHPCTRDRRDGVARVGMERERERRTDSESDHSKEMSRDSICLLAGSPSMVGLAADGPTCREDRTVYAGSNV